MSCLVALSFALRLWGIGFGLPFYFHPDEPVHVGEAQNLLLGRTDALSFANPALYKYILAGLFAGTIGVERVAEADTSLLFGLARATSAVIGTLNVLTVYWLVCMLRGRRAGLVGAALAATCLLLVRESHFAVNDTLAALAATVALAACVRVAARGTRRDYLLGGLSAGVAFASKFQALAVVVPLALAHVRPHQNRRHLDLGLALLGLIAAAVLTFPPMVTETRRVLGDMWVNLVLPSRLGWDGLDPAGGYVYYLKVMYWAIGWPIVVLALAATARAVVGRDWLVLVVASLPVTEYLVMGASRIYFARYLLPSAPAIVALAAVALHDLAKRRVTLAALGAAAALAVSVPNTLKFDALLTTIDTRTLARNWVAANLPPGTRVAAEREAIGPPLESLPIEVSYPDGRALYDRTLEEYKADGIGYVVASSFTSDGPVPDQRRDARRREFYERLRIGADQVAQFRPYRDKAPDYVYDRLYGPVDSLFEFDRPGPTLTIYRLR